MASLLQVLIKKIIFVVLGEQPRHPMAPSRFGRTAFFHSHWQWMKGKLLPPVLNFRNRTTKHRYMLINEWSNHTTSVTDLVTASKACLGSMRIFTWVIWPWDVTPHISHVTVTVTHEISRLTLETSQVIITRHYSHVARRMSQLSHFVVVPVAEIRQHAAHVMATIRWLLSRGQTPLPTNPPPPPPSPLIFPPSPFITRSKYEVVIGVHMRWVTSGIVCGMILIVFVFQLF